MIVFAYNKDSPMLERYLEMNRMKAVEVWPERGYRGKNRVALMTCETSGFPLSDDKTNEYWRGTMKEALALAKRVSEHTGLPLRH